MITTGSPLMCRSLRILATLVFLWTLVSTALAAGVVGIERILVTVSDLDRAEGFYRDGLGFETVGRAEIAGDGFAHLVGLRDGRATTLTMRLGLEEVTFVKYGAPGKPYPADSRSPDRWFQHFAIVVSDMDKAYGQLQRVGFTPSSNDVRRRRADHGPASAGGNRAGRGVPRIPQPRRPAGLRQSTRNPTT